MKKENTKQKLLDVAIDLFSKKGYDSVSVREITRKVGVKESALYNHFKGKEDLLNKIFDLFIKNVGTSSFSIKTLEEELNQMDLSAFLQYQQVAFYKNITPRMGKIWLIVYMEQFKNKRARDFVLNEIMGRPDQYYKRVFEMAREKNMIITDKVDVLAKMYQYTLLSLSWELLLRQINDEDISEIIKQRHDLIQFICSQ